MLSPVSPPFKELELYKAELVTKPALLVVNKMDLPDAEDKLAQLKEQLQNPDGKYFMVYLLYRVKMQMKLDVQKWEVLCCFNNITSDVFLPLQSSLICCLMTWYQGTTWPSDTWFLSLPPLGLVSNTWKAASESRLMKTQPWQPRPSIKIGCSYWGTNHFSICDKHGRYLNSSVWTTVHHDDRHWQS